MDNFLSCIFTDIYYDRFSKMCSSNNFIQDHWFDLGLDLGLPCQTLEHIRANNCENDCLKLCLEVWQAFDGVEISTLKSLSFAKELKEDKSK